MKRRDLFKLAGWSLIGATLPPAFRTYAAGEGYAGQLYVTIQVSGAPRGAVWRRSRCPPPSPVFHSAA